MTFFGDSTYLFPAITDQGHIEVIQLLRASRHIVKFLEGFGTTFSPIRSDISGNIEKLQTKYNTDPVTFSHIEAMFLDEQENKTTNYAGISGLWLKRALEFIHVFLSGFLEEHKAGNTSQSLHPLIQKSYEETLSRYHGWLVQKLFPIISIAAPSRTGLMNILCKDTNLNEEQFINDLQVYLDSLSSNLEVFKSILIKYNLDNNDKV
ncbi:glycolipid transfer protein [Octopus bimaculoides]|uniref:Glycolipid transfer protein domain-containing protein n=1 Tax=Octopus bimaculoides TaxID=37653 RepID=A0A0L8H370_OCTBM|nr:glycolipid transfer protein [Octopus bimaculoides]XP_014775864.1 glycolipid transfer protein [Octopus bimaculoides]|eukprot:XP_014775862.1 PREDICTED: glycolipid transfer protein-like [Octopus bimaculoides]